MSREIVKGLEANINRVYGFIDTFIDTCPENIWHETSGGWPIWQQILHTIACIEFFTLEEDEIFTDIGFDRDIWGLKIIGTQNVSKEEIKKIFTIMKKQTSKYSEALTDSTLSQKNEGFSKRRAMNASHATIMGLLAGHALYHLGSCDAALRNHNLPGVF